MAGWRSDRSDPLIIEPRTAARLCSCNIPKHCLLVGCRGSGVVPAVSGRSPWWWAKPLA
jgi:hypothetical protein